MGLFFFCRTYLTQFFPTTAYRTNWLRRKVQRLLAHWWYAYRFPFSGLVLTAAVLADRLWIQRAHPKPPRYTATTSSLKRKRPENTAKASAAKSKRPAAKRARLASEDPKLTITVPGGGRAAKAQAKLKLDAQAKELAELNRAAGLRAPATRASHGGRTPVAPVRPLGTRVSARLRGADEEEWQAIPEDWLTEGGSKKKTPVKPKPKTGLESDDDSVSDLTELSEEPIEEVKEDEESAEVEEASQAEENREDGQPEGFVEWETVSAYTVYDSITIPCSMLHRFA